MSKSTYIFKRFLKVAGVDVRQMSGDRPFLATGSAKQKARLPSSRQQSRVDYCTSRLAQAAERIALRVVIAVTHTYSWCHFVRSAVKLKLYDSRGLRRDPM